MSLTFALAYAEFISYLAESGRHLRTIAAAGYSLQYFGNWLASATDLEDLRAVRREHILAYADYVRTRPHRRTGQPLGPRYRLSLFASCACSLLHFWNAVAFWPIPCTGYACSIPSRSGRSRA